MAHDPATAQAIRERRGSAVNDARNALGLLRAFPEMPDIEGRITERGSLVLDRIGDAFEALLKEVAGRGALKAPEPEWAKVKAGNAHVEAMRDRADDKVNLLWHGWALREAFIAGAEWQERRKL